MENVPAYVGIIFGLTTLLTIYFFALATTQMRLVLSILFIWLAAQAVISITGFYYRNTHAQPPAFLLATLPNMLVILVLFITKRGRTFIDGMNLKVLTILHIIRIPVEIVLLWLCMHKVVPQIMTFEGRNFDILSGISAPFIYYIAFRKETYNKWVLLVWNIICLILLINIVSIAILSAPFAFQRFGLDQPNIAVLYFPYIWLPACVVPVVLLSHLASIRLLLKKSK
ncbi:hypothetical protein SAMN05444410_10393 [Hydrobacter penzbergensis]|jgi:hypothetical protein|uniref:Uncharacterized protein n=1 Tax=Hydrobacter penzbergensis TaxID=1235997 RepID=A0A8X8IAG6_9BACT|nr:hypothetical protein [Hydrobacter penzbergensis]SDW48610.1 hypothetical protein SAMN05444410_10393 [Hydrobacter penzbergensis]